VSGGVIIVFFIVPLIVASIVARWPVPRYIRPRLVFELCIYIGLGAIALSVGDDAAPLITLLALPPLLALGATMRWATRRAALDDLDGLDRALKWVNALSWPTRATPLWVALSMNATSSIDRQHQLERRLAALSGRSRVTPMVDLAAAVLRGDRDDLSTRARHLLGSPSGHEEQAAAASWLCRTDLPFVLKWWNSPYSRRTRRRHSTTVLLSIAAAAGQTDEVRSITATLAGATSAKFLVAVADLSAGVDADTALRPLRELGTRAAAFVATLEQQPPLRQHLDASQQAQLTALMDDLGRNAGAMGRDTGEWRPLISWSILALLTVVFAFQVVSGGFGAADLYDSGAAVIGGDRFDWWRAVTGSVLHASLTHFLLNALALTVIARVAEARLSRWLFLTIWVAASIGAFVVYAIFPPDQPTLAVGASGGVMGLLGASVCASLVNQRRQPSAMNSRSLRVLLVITVLQLVADSSIPNVAQLGHVAGFIIGSLLVGAAALRPSVAPHGGRGLVA
jgi:membrane associated rhomboid family serine protease